MYQIDFNRPQKIYFIGIGGISMSGLAEILFDEGFQVMGSDMKKSELTDRLEQKGIKVEYGQRASNIPAESEYASDIESCSAIFFIILSGV